MANQSFVGTVKRKNESDVTYALKWAAWRWLRDHAGCKAIAFEVRLEGPGGRIADVVGVGPRNRVYVVEVKASRSDAARDDNTKRAAAKLAGQRAAIDETVELSAGILEAAAMNSTRIADNAGAQFGPTRIRGRGEKTGRVCETRRRHVGEVS